MARQKGDRLITTGVIGSITAVICCVSPVLVVLLGAVGLAGAVAYLDYVLFPAIAIFLAMVACGWWIKYRRAAKSKEENSGRKTN